MIDLTAVALMQPSGVACISVEPSVWSPLSRQPGQGNAMVNSFLQLSALLDRAWHRTATLL